MKTAQKITAIIAAFIVIAIIAIIAFYYEKPHQYYQVDAAYQAQVDEYFVPPMPKDWRWSRFTTTDNTQLRWGETGNRNAARASLLIIPGYTATLDMYGEHAEYFAQQGYHVIGLDLRGQGGSQRYRDSQPEKLWIDDFQTYSDDVAAFIKSQNLPKDRVLIPVAISFGGHVATRMAVEHAGLIDGLFLLAPAFVPKAGAYDFETALKMMQWGRKIGKSKDYVLGEKNWQPKGTDFTQANIDMCSSEPRRLYLRDVIFTRQPKQRVGGVTHQWGAEFFESSQILMQQDYLVRLKTPVLIISAFQDDFVDTKANKMACSDLMTDCQEIEIPDTGHCLMQEHDADLAIIFEALDAFVNNMILLK